MVEGKINLSSQEILRLSWPVFISLIAQNLIGVIDTAFVSRVGEIELGGTAMGSLVYFSIYTVGWGLASGTQIMISHRYGAKKFSQIGRVLGQSIRLLLFAALLVMALGFTLGPKLFNSLLSSENVAKSAVDYWTYRSFGFPFAFLAATFRSFFVGISRTKVLTLNSVVMSIVNITLDYGLIFGNLGLPEMGVKGAALASVVAEISSLVFYILYTLWRLDGKFFGLNRANLMVWDKGLSKKLFGLSYYLMLQAFVSQAAWAIFFFMIESLGERQLAIASITRQLYVLFFIPLNSYGTAVRTTVGHIVGAGMIDQLLDYLFRAIKISFGTMLVFFVFVQIFPEIPLRIFTDNMDLIRSSVPTLRILATAALIASAGNMFFNAVSSSGNTQRVFQIEMLNASCYLIYGGIVVYLLGGTVAMCFTVEIIYFLSIAVMSYKSMKRLIDSSVAQ
ncbi:MATE family efflux transporter [uncultured Porphyromonas sp.]|uniref:MATE family efflux transporter n=1 Tax=uncultured Porphyromonas sp. TaxID=159274 RepID=UPI00261F23A2|nr:MATE family efflux transporter [uncultured Porphyromonas sp.]